MKLHALDGKVKKITSSNKSPSTSGVDEAMERGQVDALHIARDMTSLRLSSDGLAYKNRAMFLLPDSLRLKTEVSQR